MMMQSYKRARGFTLIEALIAVVILAVGLLAIARFQSSLVTASGESKARAEAIAIAQQKLDEIRSYIDQDELVSNLSAATVTSTTLGVPTDPTDGTYPTTPESVSGTNADFQRQWVISTSGTTKNIQVNVTWTDLRTNTQQTISLNSTVGWTDPKLAARLDLGDYVPLVPNATGRARLGDGEYVDASGNVAIPTGATGNDDGTYTYKNLETGEVELIDSVTGSIVLTLEEACNTYEGGHVKCTDFVKISGKIYVDDASMSGGNGPSEDTIFVLASDAAYCAQQTDTMVTTSPDGQYRYWDYKCYLGGSWHGNIGVLQADNTQHEVCVGDPDDASDPVSIANRRVYRGMLSKDIYTLAGTLTSGADTVVDDDDNDGVENYYSTGVADALELPNPYDNDINTYYSTYGYLPGHNFLISNLSANPTIDECEDAMERSERLLTITDGGNSTTVEPFSGSPDDFFCLNQVKTYSTTDASGNFITAVVPFFDYQDRRIANITEDPVLADGYLDVADNQILIDYVDVDASGNQVIAQVQSISKTGTTTMNGVTVPTFSTHNLSDYGAFMDVAGCPFDPADPPAFVDFLTGSIYRTDEGTLASGFVVNTSDDLELGTAGNCTVTDLGSPVDAGEVSGVHYYRIADYSCRFYHHYDQVAGSGDGWEGMVAITPANGFLCTPATYTYENGTSLTALTADSGTQTGTPDTPDFSCYAIDTDVVTDLVTTVELTEGDNTPLDTDTYKFRITVENASGVDATNVSLSVPIPTGLQMTYSFATVGTSYDDATGLWTINNVLTAGTTVSLTLHLTLDTASGGAVGDAYTLTATTPSAEEADVDTTTDDLSETILITSSTTANLITELTLLSGNPNPGVGELVQYLITVTNAGGDDIGTTSTLDVSTLLSASDWANVQYIGQTPVGNLPTFSGSTWTIPALNDASSATMVMQGEPKNAMAGTTFTMTVTPAVVTAGTPSDPSTALDILSVPIQVSTDANADLTTSLELTSGNLAPAENQTVTFLLTVENYGPSDAGSTFLTVPIPTGLTLSATPVPSHGVYDSVSGIWYIGTVTQGTPATLTLEATVTGTAGDTITVSTTVADSTDTNDPNLTPDGATSVTLTVAGGSTTVTISGLIEYPDYASDNQTVSAITAYAVNSGAISNATTCTFSGDAGIGTHKYTCNVTLDTSNLEGIALDVSYGNDTVCWENAKIAGSSISLSTNASSTWVGFTSVPATGTVSYKLKGVISSPCGTNPN